MDSKTIERMCMLTAELFQSRNEHPRVLAFFVDCFLGTHWHRALKYQSAVHDVLNEIDGMQKRMLVKNRSYQTCVMKLLIIIFIYNKERQQNFLDAYSAEKLQRKLSDALLQAEACENLSGSTSFVFRKLAPHMTSELVRYFACLHHHMRGRHRSHATVVVLHLLLLKDVLHTPIPAAWLDLEGMSDKESLVWWVWFFLLRLTSNNHHDTDNNDHDAYVHKAVRQCFRIYKWHLGLRKLNRNVRMNILVHMVQLYCSPKRLDLECLDQNEMTKINDSACKMVQQAFDYVPPQPQQAPKSHTSTRSGQQQHNDVPQKPVNPRLDYLNCVVYREI